MRVAGIGVAIPSLKVTNQDILRRIAANGRSAGHAQAIQRSVASLLDAAGSEVRYYLDVSARELPRDLLARAMQKALADAAQPAEAIDLLLYCGMGRGFIEPGNAYFCAQQLGIRCACFDIGDACMGWLRAAQIAHDGMAAGRYRNVLIVSGEFGMQQEYFADAWQISNPLELRRLFAAYTLGEAACATLLSTGGPAWSFHFVSRPDLADLCTLPLPGYADFAPMTWRLEQTRPLSFSSHSAELFAAAEQELAALVEHVVEELDAPQLYVPHTASNLATIAAAGRLGLPLAKLYTEIMPRYGNVASASLPLGLRKAADEGRLKPGDDVVLIPVSAGMSVGVARFVWTLGGSAPETSIEW